MNHHATFLQKVHIEPSSTCNVTGVVKKTNKRFKTSCTKVCYMLKLVVQLPTIDLCATTFKTTDKIRSPQLNNICAKM